MRDFKDKVVVVTGAASGIGREIAMAFARRGAQLAVADTDVEGLRKVQGELESMGCVVYAQVVDVAQAEQVGDFCDNVYREMDRTDVLCNNAGVALGGYLEDLTVEDWQWVVGINFMGVVHGCQFFYPRMIEQGGGGHIVNTASAAGLIPTPGLLAYCATKHAVVGFSETLRSEAARHGVGVSVLCPGFVLTGIFRSSRMKTIPDGETKEEGVERAERILGRRRCTAASVAEEAVKAVERNRSMVMICPETYIMDFFYRLSRRAYSSFLIHVTRPGSELKRNKPG